MSKSPNIDPRLCVLCRGRGWCGLSYCLILVRQYIASKLGPLKLQREIFGSSPPSVFIGRHGYPLVRIGLGVPPEEGDTLLYDYPEKWISLGLNDILNYRLTMILGYDKARKDELASRLVRDVQEVSMSIRPVDVEIRLAKPPRPSLILDETNPPLGPRSPLEAYKVSSNPYIPRIVDKVVNDDIKAIEAVNILYENNLPVSYIQRVFSVGLLGARSERRLVPTRWSITAVDSIISSSLLKEVKKYEPLDKFYLYDLRLHDNLFIAILAPRKWSFEWMEAWWPGSTWNPFGLEVSVEGDYELYRGRRGYPSIGGCYYASRLATVEHLRRLRKQAAAILLREIYPGFNLPIGVWFVREALRKAYEKGPVLITNDFKEVLNYLDENTRLKSARWLKASRLLNIILRSEDLKSFLAMKGERDKSN
ncbi:Nre family DNA repair protein [Thermogladius sp. 4427co]|uniref:Nre family DNA repair protein n=1 Tax=Thermogladius sp. 4427co TaxID=3450718 RepID=UPI003F78D0DA